jgi:hypothetical protein
MPPADRRTLLAAGLSDPHEDVLEEAIAAHITLFHTLTSEEQDAARARRSLLESAPTFHARERANVLMELLSAAGRPVITEAASPALHLRAGVAT